MEADMDIKTVQKPQNHDFSTRGCNKNPTKELFQAEGAGWAGWNPPPPASFSSH